MTMKVVACPRHGSGQAGDHHAKSRATKRRRILSLGRECGPELGDRRRQVVESRRDLLWVAFGGWFNDCDRRRFDGNLDRCLLGGGLGVGLPRSAVSRPHLLAFRLVVGGAELPDDGGEERTAVHDVEVLQTRLALDDADGAGNQLRDR